MRQWSVGNRKDSVSQRPRPRRRRLEAFTTDAKIIRLISRRVAIFPAASARQIFDGDCDAANRTKIPWSYRRISTLCVPR